MTAEAFIYAVASGVAVVVAVLAWQRRRSPGGVWLTLASLACAVWTLGISFDISAASVRGHYLASEFSYLGAVFAPALLLLFSLEYTGHGKWVTPWSIGALFIVPVVTLGLAFTNDLHHLVWKGIRTVGGGLPNYVHGSAYWLFTVYGFAVFAAAAAVLIGFAFRVRGIHRAQSALIIAAVAIPAFAMLVYDFAPQWTFGNDPSIALVGTCAVMTIAMLRFGLLDVVPIARDRLIERMGDGLLVVDDDGRVIDMNPAAEALFSIESGWRGRASATALASWPAAATTIATHRQGDAEVTLVTGDGRSIGFDVCDIDGEESDLSSGKLVVLRDVSREVEGRDLASALNDIATALTSTFDEEEILGDLTSMSCRALEATGAICVMAEGDEWCVRAVAGTVPLDESHRFDKQRLHLLESALQERRPIAIDDVQHDDMVADCGIDLTGLRSLVAVPLVAKGGVEGALVVVFAPEGPQLSAQKLDFTTKLMSMATVALESAKLYERERRIAQTLQEAILEAPRSVKGLDVAHVYRPALAAADVGGDFYDVFQLDEHHVSVLVGDVSGKGLEAARITTIVRDGMRAYALESLDPGVVLCKVNELLYRSTAPDTFATALLLIIDTRTGAFDVAAAGHPFGVVIRHDEVEPIESRSGLLGAFSGVTFECTAMKLGARDTVVVYTDGLPEARRGIEMFGNERVFETIRKLRTLPLAELPKRLVEEVTDFTDSGLRDDAIVLALRLARTR